MNTVTVEHMRSFAVEQLWPLRESITERTAIAHDFGLADTTVKNLWKHTHGGFVLTQVLLTGWNTLARRPEGIHSDWSLNLYKRFVRGIPARELAEPPEITLGHLAKCANLDKWETPKETHNHPLKPIEPKRCSGLVVR